MGAERAVIGALADLTARTPNAANQIVYTNRIPTNRHRWALMSDPSLLGCWSLHGPWHGTLVLASIPRVAGSRARLLEARDAAGPRGQATSSNTISKWVRKADSKSKTLSKSARESVGVFSKSPEAIKL